MRSRMPIIFLAIAILLAAGAAWGAHQWINLKAYRLAAGKVAMSPVVAAARDLPAGHMLEASDLAVQRWPSASVPNGRFTSAGKLAGRVLRTPITKGEVILAGKLAQEGLAGGLSAILPDGFRAMTLKVDEIVGVGGYLQAGDHVDVLLTVDQGSFREDPVTSTVLKDIPVLTVGAKVIGEEKDKKAKRAKVTAVTLKLTPEQAEQMAMAMLVGRVVLSLRNQKDGESPATGGIRLAGLLGLPTDAPAPAPAPLPAAPMVSAPASEPVEPPEAVEIIKGVQISTQNM